MAPSVLDGAEPGSWTGADTALAVALTAYEDDLHECGWPLSVTSDKKLRMHWVSPPPKRCHACAQRELGAKPYLEDSHRPKSLMFPVTLTERGAAYLRGETDNP